MLPTRGLLWFAAIALLFSSHLVQAYPSRVVNCPCKFSVTRMVDDSRGTKDGLFDVLVSKIGSPRLPLESFSRRKISIKDASHIDETYHHFPDVRIPIQGVFLVQVKHSLKASSVYLIDLHTSQRQIPAPAPRCPIIFPYDIPKFSPYTARNRRAAKQLIAPSPIPSGNHSASGYITGGRFASNGIIPYLVALFTAGTICTGTLISPRWVLTAAHCAPSAYTTVGILSQIAGQTGYGLGVEQAFPHPMYDAKSDIGRSYDIAAVKLSVSVENCCGRTYKTAFMKINAARQKPITGAFVRVAGYGRTHYHKSIRDDIPSALRQVDVPVSDNERCKRLYANLLYPVKLYFERQLCTGYDRCDQCFGDSGGPIFQYDSEGKPVLISLITTGVDCGYSRVPGVSVRVAYFRKWLYDIGVDFTQHSDVLPQIRRQCEAGKALLSIGSGVAKCADCPERSYSYKGTGRYCYRCKGNLLRDTIRGDRCSCRRKVGYGLVDGSCVRCKEGTDSSFGHNRCLVELRP